jgi:ankyrin repeat protein
MVQKKWPQRVKDLIEAKNKKHKTAIMRASGFDDIEIVKLLLDHGADWTKKDYRDRSAEVIASENGRGDIVKLLEEKRMGQDSVRQEKQKNLKDLKSLNNMHEFFKSKLYGVKRQIEDIINMMDPQI